MQIAVHWQDANSSANAVNEVFPEAEIMLCGGHAGRAHRKQLEERSRQKAFTDVMISRYKKVSQSEQRVVSLFTQSQVRMWVSV